jgi:uncharacterized protein YgiM (DUF1202 family)
VENGFMDSVVDVPIILSDKHANDTALGLVNFLVANFGLTRLKVETPAANSFKVKVKVAELNYRAGAGTEYKVNGVIKKNEIYTIVDTAKANDGDTWGKLKSGAGWININSKYVSRV